MRRVVSMVLTTHRFLVGRFVQGRSGYKKRSRHGRECKEFVTAGRQMIGGYELFAIRGLAGSHDTSAGAYHRHANHGALPGRSGGFGQRCAHDWMRSEER